MQLDQPRLGAQLEELLRKTESGEIIWVRTNPSTLLYRKESTALSPMPLSTSLQFIVDRRGETYLFTVQAGPNIAVSINSGIEREYHKILDTIYVAAMVTMSKKALDIFDVLLE